MAITRRILLKKNYKHAKDRTSHSLKWKSFSCKWNGKAPEEDNISTEMLKIEETRQYNY